MSKIRTVADAQGSLDHEYAWRIREIADVKAAIRSSRSIRQRSLMRAGVPLLYAHWEGFVKRASEAYLNYVSNQRHEYRELKSCFVVRGLKRELDELSTSSKARRNIEIVEFVIGRLAERATIPWRGAVDAKSNLSSLVFDDIASSIGIDTKGYMTKYNFIDESLLRRRNKIAHGESLDVDINDFLSLCNDVIGLMRSYKTDIENALELQSYKRIA